MRWRLLLLVAMAGCGRDLSIPVAPHDDAVRPRAPAGVAAEPAPARGVVNVLWNLEPQELERATSHTTGLVVLRRDGVGEVQPPPDGAPIAEGRLSGNAVVVFVTDDVQLSFFDDAGARRGHLYTYAVVGHNSAYLWGPVATTVGALPPLAPVAVTADEDPESGIEVSWNLTSEGASLQALVVRNEGAELTERPLDGVPYAVGQTLGTGRVVFAAAGERYVDTSVRAGVEYHYTVFAAGEGWVYSPARASTFTLEGPSFAAATVNPRIAGRRTQVAVEFTVARKLVELESPPVVKVAGRDARPDPDAGLAHPSYRFVYDVTGDEPADATADVHVQDYTGETVLQLPISFDFTAPQLLGVVSQGGPFRKGQELSLEVTADEPMGSLLAFVRGAPMACAATPDARVWTCTYVVTGIEPVGAQGVALAFTDRAGNGGTAWRDAAFVVQ
jgi:hypothetical protein